jgi:hypothetical protein
MRKGKDELSEFTQIRSADDATSHMLHRRAAKSETYS